MGRPPIIIKKYENRRLYDATNSRYVNQDEIARMIREGRDVQVLDAATGEDLTRLILTQIIVEDAKGPDSNFPLDILRQMVVASGKATQENTLQYMKAVLDIYRNAYRAFAPPVSPFEFMQPGSRPGAALPEPARTEAAGTQALQDRVDELEALVAKMAAQRKPARKKTKAKPRRAR